VLVGFWPFASSRRRAQPIEPRRASSPPVEATSRLRCDERLSAALWRATSAFASASCATLRAPPRRSSRAASPRLDLNLREPALRNRDQHRARLLAQALAIGLDLLESTRASLSSFVASS
jgi:hypothetical protein